MAKALLIRDAMAHGSTWSVLYGSGLCSPRVLWHRKVPPKYKKHRFLQIKCFVCCLLSAVCCLLAASQSPTTGSKSSQSSILGTWRYRNETDVNLKFIQYTHLYWSVLCIITKCCALSSKPSRKGFLQTCATLICFPKNATPDQHKTIPNQI